MNKRIVILVGLYLTGFSAISTAAAADALDPYPLDYWALRAVVNNAQVSPDGKYLALMKIPSKDGNPIIEVYEAANLDKKPFRLNADPMEIETFYWVSNKDIVFQARQKVRDKIEGFNEGVYENRIALVDVKNKKLENFDEVNPFVENVLPNKPGKIIISFSEGESDGPGSKLSEAFRPRAYWEFDLNKGTKKLLIRGKLSVGNIEFNGNGEPWGARGFDLAKGDFIWYIRRPGKSGWEEIMRMSEDRYDDFFIESIDDTKPNHVLVAAQNGDDKQGFWSYNIDTKQYDELIYRRKDVDVWSARYHSNSWEYPDTVVGINYLTDKLHTEYFDEVEGATYKQLEQVIPYSHYLNINSRSRDGNTMTILNQGPRDPGTYYMLKDGQLKSVGSRQPLLESENLADLDYITYDARDGVPIRAYVTVPQGEAPFPLIVLPHGGPFVAESVIYDEWSQLLANNGFMVVQPQYRGSFNYGLEFHKISFENGGQGGYAMQDDKDDAAKYLVERGLADPERLAMFGWSYGGYAALVAASRQEQIYQCVIAGAAPTDMIQQINYYRYRLRGAQKERQIAYREDSINPIDEVAKINVPMLLIHGNVDQRVPVTHAKRYRKLLDQENINYKYLELDGADHFSNTWTYYHKKQIYSSLLDFLKNDCGQVSMQARVSE